MGSALGPVEVDCPECGETVAIPLVLTSLPKINPGNPLLIDFVPDRDAIQQHIEQAHSDED